MENLEKTNCPRHPKTETSLRCASCGELICPQCLVLTPVGAKCKDCGTYRGGKLYALTPLQTAAVIGVGLLAGAVAGWAVAFRIGIFFTIFLAFIYGRFVGEMIVRAACRRRGARLELLAGVTLVLGVVFGRLLIAAALMASPGQTHPPLGLMQVLYSLVLPTPIPLAALVIVVASAISRIRNV